jgi:hypothetical protein
MSQLQMSQEDQDLVKSIYVLDSNCMDEDNHQTSVYKLVGNSGALKATQAKKCFATLRVAMEEEFGQLLGLPR